MHYVHNFLLMYLFLIQVFFSFSLFLFFVKLEKDIVLPLISIKSVSRKSWSLIVVIIVFHGQIFPLVFLIGFTRPGTWNDAHIPFEHFPIKVIKHCVRLFQVPMLSWSKCSYKTVKSSQASVFFFCRNPL